MINIKSLQRLETATLKRVVIEDCEASLSMDFDRSAEIFGCLPTTGNGVLAVQDTAAIKNVDYFADEVVKSGYVYLLVTDGVEGAVEAFRALPSTLSVDGVSIKNETLQFRVVVSHPLDQSAQVLTDFASLFADRVNVVSEVVEYEEPPMGGLRIKLFNAGVRLVKPLKDYLPTAVTVALYRFAHRLRG